MEVFNAFSIADFLAYLFPGIFSLGGIYAIMLLTPLQIFLPNPYNIGLGGWIAIFCISYIIGVIVSGITDAVFRRSSRSNRRKINKGTIQIHDEKLKVAVKEAFEDLFFQSQKPVSQGDLIQTEVREWNESYYYVCRSLVTETMLRAAAAGSREGAYRQLRMNLVGATAIWSAAGILWSVILLLHEGNIYLNNEITITLAIGWPILLLVLSIVAPFYLVRVLVKMMDLHEQREVREVLTSFLSGYKAGIIKKLDR
jgi:hypothetical protein